MNNKAFFYVEFEQLEGSGHRLNTANQYAKKLREQEVFHHFFIVGVEASGEDLAKVLIDYDKKFFCLKSIDDPNSKNINIDEVGRGLEDVISQVVSNTIGCELYIYTHMPSPFALLALYLAIRNIRKKVGCLVRVLVRLCMTDEEWSWYQFRLSKIIVLIKSDCLVGDLFSFTTESARLNSYYLEKAGIVARTQFNPFSLDEVKVTENKQSYHAAIFGARLNFVYLGEAREEKGFQFLPDLVGVLIEQSIDFEFYIHCYSNPGNNTEAIRSAREKLRAFSHSRVANQQVRLYDFPIPSFLYTLHQRIADVVVMPYAFESYYIRGSGVAFEAICSNAFLLLTQDTDMSETFRDSSKVVEFKPECIDPAVIHNLKELVLGEREGKGLLRHPANIYSDCFFENELQKHLCSVKSPSLDTYDDELHQSVCDIFSAGGGIEEMNNSLGKLPFQLT